MSTKVRRVNRDDGDLICITMILDAPPSTSINPDGTVQLDQYLTMDQWERFQRADGQEINEVVGTSA